MIKVYQDKFGPGGNCLQACIASIMDMPLKEVPHFCPDPNDTNGEWHDRLFAFLRSFELDMFMVYIRPYEMPDVPKNRYHIMSGISPRGILHACVGFNGRIVHDPHPSGDGLLTVADYMVIHKPSESDMDIFGYDRSKEEK